MSKDPIEVYDDITILGYKKYRKKGESDDNY